MFNNIDNKSNYVAYFLAKVIETIADNYYYDVTYEDLYHAAINGMADILDDFSIYMSNKMEKDKLEEKQNRGESTYNLEKEKQVSQTVYDYFFDELINLEDAHKYKDIKLIKITEINKNTVGELEKIIEHLREEYITKVIIDLRDNIGGNIDTAVDICNLLVRKRILFMSYDKKKFRKTYKSDLIKKPFDEIVVLTNNKTMSAAELIALALQDDGNIVIGQKTYGKGISQQIFNIYGKGVLKITTKEYFQNCGDSINNKGVNPNLVVECLNSNSDYEILERAYLYITEKIVD